MLIFSNPFFSIEGQKERLKNVGNTLVAAVTGKGVQSNTGQKQVDAVLGYAASNPFVTAAVGAAAYNPSALASAAKSGYGALSPTAKLATVVAAPVVVGAVVSNPGLVSKAGKAPSDLARFGSDLGEFAEDPTLSGAKQILSNSPLISGGIALGGAALIGGGIAGTLATIANTSAIKKNTQSSTLPASLPSGVTSSPSVLTGGGVGSPIPLTPETMVIGREVTSGSVARRVKARRAQRQSVSVRILNQNTYIGAR